jgi:hypothetical protein
VKEENPVQAGQRWVHIKTGQVARVMAVGDGYVMARYKGAAIPWCKHWKEFVQNYQPKVGP